MSEDLSVVRTSIFTLPARRLEMILLAANGSKRETKLIFLNNKTIIFLQFRHRNYDSTSSVLLELESETCAHHNSVIICAQL
jgi:hypothetical protein